MFGPYTAKRNGNIAGMRPHHNHPVGPARVVQLHANNQPFVFALA
jgi:hypothetical protein